MLRHAENGIEWLTFELFAECKELKHGILLRKGGHSQKNFASLNLSFSVGDNNSHVQQNLQKVQKACRLPPLSTLRQAHGKAIWDLQMPCSEASTADALVTRIPHQTLFITHADCQAAIFYDPVNHVLANVHAGWRGNVQQIYREVIEYLKGKYGTQPKNILAGISPSLGPKHAEFKHYQQEFPQAFWEYQVAPNYFDLWAIAKMQLIACGLLDSHIEIAQMDTFDAPGDFFSYRRDRETGRNATFAVLLEKNQV
jgi:hypothetical protein